MQVGENSKDFLFTYGWNQYAFLKYSPISFPFGASDEWRSRHLIHELNELGSSLILITFHRLPAKSASHPFKFPYLQCIHSRISIWGRAQTAAIRCKSANIC